MHDAASAFRGLLPVLALFLAAFLLMGAVSTSAIPDISIFSLDYTHNQLKFRLWADSMTYPMVIGSVLFGVATAFAAFRFLLIRMQTTLYLSLPIPRRKLYITRIWVSALAMFAVLGVALLVSLVLNLMALGTWEGEAAQFLYILLGLFACALTGYVLMLVAVLLAGTQVEAVCFAVALLLAVSVGCWGVNVCMENLLVGNTAGEYLTGTQTAVGTSLLAQFATCNPLLFFVDAAARHQSFTVQAPTTYVPTAPNWYLPITWLVFACAVLMAGDLLFTRRKGEKAGIAGLCTPMTLIFTLVCGLLIFALVFDALSSVNLVCALIAGFAAFLALSFLLLRGPLRGVQSMKRSWCVLGIETAALVVGVVIIATGACGWSSAIPAASSISSAEISYTGSPSYYGKTYAAASSEEDSYYVSGTYTYRDADAIALVTATHQQLISSGRAQLATNASDFSQTVVPYDIEIRYTLADGGTVERYYDRATLAELANLLSLDDTEQLSSLRAALISGETGTLTKAEKNKAENSSAGQAYANGSIYLCDSYFGSPLAVNTTKKARAQLLKALAADISAQSSSDRYHSNSSCRGILMFSQDGSNDVQSFSYQMENTVVYLTDSFTHTLKWMKDKKLTSALAGTTAELGEMSFVRYDPYARTSGNRVSATSQYFMGYTSTSPDDFMVAPEYGTRFTVSSKRKIAKLASLLRPDYYLDAGGYLVSVKLKGSANYAYFFLPDSLAPNWLKRQAG